MRLFRKQNGVVTVFVVMIMVPTIFFVGFMDDLARLKLAGNQAVMAADNYGEMMLEQYDNILKKLYGFFAMTQMDGAAEKLDSFQEIVKASFDPNSHTIDSKYTLDFLQGSKYLGERQFEGFMPYKNADVELCYDYIKDSSLSRNEIFASQLGEFMEYRIFQQLLTADNMDLIKAVESAENSEGDGAVGEAKQKYDDELNKFIELLEKYYNALKPFTKYPDYIKKVEQAEKVLFQNFYSRYNGSDYGYYFEYKKNKEDADLANERRLEIKALEERLATIGNTGNGESEEDDDEDEEDEEDEEEPVEIEDLTDEEIRLCEIYDNYLKVLCRKLYNVSNPSEKYLEEHNDLPRIANNSWLENDIQDQINECYGKVIPRNADITIYSYEEKLEALKKAAKEVNDQKGEIQKAFDDLEAKMGADGVSPDLVKGIKEEIEEYKPLFDHPEYFNGIADLIETNKSINSEYIDQTEKLKESAKDLQADLIGTLVFSGTQNNDGTWTNEEKWERTSNQKCFWRVRYDNETSFWIFVEGEYEWPDELDPKKWKDFKDASAGGRAEYKTFYESLKRTFESDSENKSEGEKKRDKANEEKEKALNEINGDEEAVKNMNLRNIPDFYDTSDGEGGGSFSLSNITNLFSLDGLKNMMSSLLLKFYAIEYDFGMFSSRVTNEKKSNDGNTSGEGEMKKESLTGYVMSEDINYLFKAEVEYILGGNKESVQNLNYTRNRILTFRVAMNYASTYKVAPINDAIRTIAGMVPTVILKVAVGIALRAAVTAFETAADWNLLKSGEKVVVLKNEVGDMTSVDKIMSLLGIDDDKKDSGQFKLDYEQYMTIMLLFFTDKDKVFARTRNLVELNVNNVLQHDREGRDITSLKFDMKKAYTAADITCSVRLDFLVMPEGFARSSLGEDETLESLLDFQDNRYNFTITRGY